MTYGPIPSVTSHAITHIASKLGVDVNVVDKIIVEFVQSIRTAIRREIPFQVRGLGKFYLKYSRRNVYQIASEKLSLFDGKTRRSLHFESTDELKAEIHGWVHDFGLKNNSSKEFARLRIRPDELDKLRKKKVLDEQRALGFRSDLLFDELPEDEKKFEESFGNAPTVEQIMRRIGMNLGD